MNKIRKEDKYKNMRKMNIIKLTNKKLNSEDIKNLFGPNKLNDKTALMEINIPFESELAVKSVNKINETLSNDDEIINYLIESNFDELDEIVWPSYKEYLDYGIEYITKLIDGKIQREAIVNEKLKDVSTKYTVAINDILFGDASGEQIILSPWYPLGAFAVFDYETINTYAPDVVNKLIDNGYVTIEEIEVDED